MPVSFGPPQSHTPQNTATVRGDYNAVKYRYSTVSHSQMFSVKLLLQSEGGESADCTAGYNPVTISHPGGTLKEAGIKPFHHLDPLLQWISDPFTKIPGSQSTGIPKTRVPK